MHRSTDRILTTHVGSLIRPGCRSARIFAAKRRGRQPYDAARVRRTLARGKSPGCVRQQAEVGVDVVSDGEFGKSDPLVRNTSSSAWAASSGGRSGRRATRLTRGADSPSRRFAEFYNGARRPRDRVKAADRLRWWSPHRSTTPAQAALQRDIDNFKSAFKSVNGARRFMPVAAPSQPSSRTVRTSTTRATTELHGRDRRWPCTTNTSRSSTPASWCSSTTRASPSPMTAWCRRRTLDDYRK